MATAIEIGTRFFGLLLEVLPFFAVGALTGALVQAYASERITTRLLGGGGAGSILNAVAAGAILPGCSCTTVPMARGLQGTGKARVGTVAAFIMVSPLLSPTTVALTWGVLGWQFTAARLVASVVGAVILGLVILRFDRWFSSGSGFDHAPGTDQPCNDGCCTPERPTLKDSFLEILRETLPYLVLGLAVAALLMTLVPEDAIPRLLGSSSGIAAFALAAIIGMPLYTCEGEEVPLTLGLLGVGLGTGPALTFLLGSVGTCVPTVLMARSVIGNRATAFYLAFWFVFAVAAGVGFQWLAG